MQTCRATSFASRVAVPSFLLDGARKTCMQDSLAVAARYLGLRLSNRQVLLDLPAADGGELEIYKAVNYMR